MNNPDMTGLGFSTVPCSWAPQMLMPPVDWNSSSRKGKKRKQSTAAAARFFSILIF
jgi:hypothetical protein